MDALVQPVPQNPSKLTRVDLDKIAAAVELRIDENGILQRMPPGLNMEPTKDTRVAPDRVQLGLNKYALEQRLEDLLNEIDQGRTQSTPVYRTLTE